MCVIIQISLQTALNMRISYNDYKLYLTIFESVSRQLNKAIKTEQELKNVPEEVTQQEYDGITVITMLPNHKLYLISSRINPGF